MPADMLVFKRRNGKSSVKILENMRNGRCHENCNIMVNTQNYKDVALFLEDLRSMWNVPIDKAVEEYKRNRQNNTWPF